MQRQMKQVQNMTKRGEQKWTYSIKDSDQAVL